MSKKISISINLIVEDPEALVREIANFYECKIEDVDRDTMLEYIDRNIKAENTCKDLFIIEGAETDGWLIQNCDCDKFLKEIRN